MTVTWDDLHANHSASNGGLTITQSSTGVYASESTTTKSTGKWYWEVHLDSIVSAWSIVGAGSGSVTTYPGSVAQSVGAVGYSSNCYVDGGLVSYWLGSQQGDTIGVAYDCDNGKIWFSKNGTWYGNPVAGTGAAATGRTGAMKPQIGLFYDTSSITANFTAASQTYSPPSGFSALDGEVVNSYSYIATGGAVAGGLANFRYFKIDNIGRGGGIGGGTADFEYVKALSLTQSGVGGAVGGGECAQEYFKRWNIVHTSVGGAVAGGSAVTSYEFGAPVWDISLEQPFLELSGSLLCGIKCSGNIFQPRASINATTGFYCKFESAVSEISGALSVGNLFTGNYYQKCSLLSGDLIIDSSCTGDIQNKVGKIKGRLDIVKSFVLIEYPGSSI